MVWLFVPIKKSLRCLLLLVIITIFGFAPDCFLNLCFLQVDILQKLFPQKSKVGDSTQISDQYGTITCYTFLPHNNFLIQNTFLIHTKSWNRTFFFLLRNWYWQKIIIAKYFLLHNMILLRHFLLQIILFCFASM